MVDGRAFGYPGIDPPSASACTALAVSQGINVLSSQPPASLKRVRSTSSGMPAARTS